MRTPDITPRWRFALHSKIFKIVPCSCSCGGNLAWVEETDEGEEIMIGCICHHSPLGG